LRGFLFTPPPPALGDFHNRGTAGRRSGKVAAARAHPNGVALGKGPMVPSAVMFLVMAAAPVVFVVGGGSYSSMG
jgi:hypothetical protein